MYLTNTGFELHTTKEGVAYKIDRKTGQTWFISGNQEALVEKRQKTELKTSTTTSSVNPYASLSDKELLKMYEESLKSEVIQAVQHSDVFGSYIQADSYVHNKLESSKEPIKSIIGWNAQKIEKNKYYVSYSYLTEQGQRGWVFEVIAPNQGNKIIRVVTGNPKLEKEYFDFINKSTGKYIDVTDEVLGLKKEKK